MSSQTPKERHHFRTTVNGLNGHNSCIVTKKWYASSSMLNPIEHRQAEEVALAANLRNSSDQLSKKHFPWKYPSKSRCSGINEQLKARQGKFMYIAPFMHMCFELLVQFLFCTGQPAYEAICTVSISSQATSMQGHLQIFRTPRLSFRAGQPPVQILFTHRGNFIRATTTGWL